jgi:hypothetical protein
MMWRFMFWYMPASEPSPERPTITISQVYAIGEQVRP